MPRPDTRTHPHAFPHDELEDLFVKIIRSLRPCQQQLLGRIMVQCSSCCGPPGCHEACTAYCDGRTCKAE